MLSAYSSIYPVAVLCRHNGRSQIPATALKLLVWTSTLIYPSDELPSAPSLSPHRHATIIATCSSIPYTPFLYRHATINQHILYLPFSLFRSQTDTHPYSEAAQQACSCAPHCRLITPARTGGWVAVRSWVTCHTTARLLKRLALSLLQSSRVSKITNRVL